MNTIDLPHDIAKAHPSRQRLYLHMIDKGESPMLAEMCALQQAPKCNTDDTWFATFGDLEDQFKGDARGLKQITEAAQKHGYKPMPSDVYDHNLAEFPGDPRGFISQAHGVKTHYRKVCEERGCASVGLVNIKAREPETDPLDVSFVADDISDRIIKDWEKEDPDITRKASLRELREEVNYKHALK